MLCTYSFTRLLNVHHFIFFLPSIFSNLLKSVLKPNEKNGILNASKGYNSMKINCFSFPCHVAVKHTPHSWSLLSLSCAISVYRFPPDPYFKTNLPPAPSLSAGPSPSSGIAADPHSFPPFLPVHYGYLKLVRHDIISLLELAEKSKLQNQSCRRSG